MNTKVSYAVAVILSGNAANFAQAASETASSDSSDNQIAEVVVTAQRRSENMQDVPITIQAITADTLEQLHVDSFDDLLKYLPNVTTAGSGAGQSNVYVRGLATSSGVGGSFNQVAIYLDDQSGQLPNRNLDVYAADLERVEVLEGPQGTLFGSGAEAGVVRYITNKPKLDVTEGNVNAGYGWTTGGDPSSNVDAMINLPLIEGTLAVRGVIYDDSRGGYINNIPGTFARSASDLVSVNYFGGAVPPNSGPINNNALAGTAINSVAYKGLRVEGLYKFNDDWNVLLMEANQHLSTDGVNWEEAYDGTGKPLPPLSVQLYNPNYNKDQFNDTTLTVNGRIDMLKFIYTGGYLERKIDQQQDYTNYARGAYNGYYQCNYPGYPFTTNSSGNIVPTAGSKGFCYSPSGYWVDQDRFTHQSHEMRLSTPDDWRMRGLVGLFYEDYRLHEQTDWFYGTSPNFVPVGPPAGASNSNPNVRPLGDSFYDDVTSGYKQKAAFASVNFDILPKTLILTAGTRYYRIENFEVGSSSGSFGCEINGPYDGDVPSYPCHAGNNNLNSKDLDRTYAGFTSLGTLSWHPTQDAMLYYTWSQGMRPGGFNKAQAQLSPTSPLYGIWKPPLAYGPDTLLNNEIGWKTEWLDHRLLVNGAIYQELWKNVQIGLFDPGVTGDLSLITNGPNYRVRGAEMSVVGRVVRGLTVTASASVNQSEVVKNLSLVTTSGQPITGTNPFGNLGTPLAQSPPFQGNVRARYDFPVGSYDAFWQIGAQHQGGSYASTNALETTLQGQTQRFYDPGFSTWNAAAGFAKGQWSAQLYGDNLSNRLGELSSSYSEYVKAVTIVRPRTYGLRFSYKFKE
jgi:iron complex outermembrane receptor protein